MKIYAFADEASARMDAQIQALRDNRLDGLEIRNVDGVNVADISLEKAYEVKAKLDAAGLAVWSVGSPIGKIGVGEAQAHVEKFKHVLQIAKILNAPNIRLFSLFPAAGQEPQACKETVIGFLRQLVELSAGCGVTLCHENEKGIYGDIAERCLEIHQALPQIKAIFDPANYIQCGVDVVQAWELLKPYVKYLHIKDALADGSVVPAGKGIGNLPYVLADFRKMGGEAVTLEPHLTVFDGLSTLENTETAKAVGMIYQYPSAEAAFCAAADACRDVLAMASQHD